MLDQLFRRLVGDKPAEFGHRIASAVTGPSLTPLAERVLDHYRNAPPPQGAEYHADAPRVHRRTAADRTIRPTWSRA